MSRKSQKFSKAHSQLHRLHLFLQKHPNLSKTSLKVHCAKLPNQAETPKQNKKGNSAPAKNSPRTKKDSLKMTKKHLKLSPKSLKRQLKVVAINLLMCLNMPVSLYGGCYAR